MRKLRNRLFELLILAILPALAAGQMQNCKAVFNGHGISQLDCNGDGRIDTVVIAGLDKDMGNTHIFIGQNLEQAKKLSRSFHKLGIAKCHDYFRVNGERVADVLRKPLDEQRGPWYFLKAIAGLLR